MGGCAGGWRLAEDGSPHHVVLQGGSGVAVAARVGRAPYRRRQDGGCPSQGAVARGARPTRAAKMAAPHTILRAAEKAGAPFADEFALEFLEAERRVGVVNFGIHLFEDAGQDQASARADKRGDLAREADEYGPEDIGGHDVGGKLLGG